MSEQGTRKHLGRGLSALFGDEPNEERAANEGRDRRTLPEHTKPHVVVPGDG